MKCDWQSVLFEGAFPSEEEQCCDHQTLLTLIGSPFDKTDEQTMWWPWPSITHCSTWTAAEHIHKILLLKPSDQAGWRSSWATSAYRLPPTPGLYWSKDHRLWGLEAGSPRTDTKLFTPYACGCISTQDAIITEEPDGELMQLSRTGAETHLVQIDGQENDVSLSADKTKEIIISDSRKNRHTLTASRWGGGGP